MQCEVVVESGAEPGQWLLELGQRVVLGRARDSGIWLKDTTIAPQHLLLQLLPAGLYVTDHVGGAFLGGAPLMPKQPTLARLQDTLEIGQHRLRLRLLDAEDVAPVFEAPRTLLEDYELVMELGRGAVGAVFAARHRVLGSQVAIKALLADVSLESEVSKRLLREAQVRLDCQHVVQTYEARIDEGQVFAVMELVHGMSAENLVKAGPMALPDALRIGEHVARALQAAHEAGIIHRDVKPENIMVTGEGVAKLSDFGIAKVLEQAGDSLTVSRTGIGTLAYVAPEQMKNAKQAGPVADLYALGSTIFHFIAGRPPREGNIEAIVLQVFEGEPPRLKSFCPSCPDDVAALIHRMMEREPGDRPQTAREVVGELVALRQRYG